MKRRLVFMLLLTVVTPGCAPRVPDGASGEASSAFAAASRVKRAEGARQRYASGDIIQYELAGEDGTVFTENQSEIRRLSVRSHP